MRRKFDIRSIIVGTLYHFKGVFFSGLFVGFNKYLLILVPNYCFFHGIQNVMASSTSRIYLIKGLIDIVFTGAHSLLYSNFPVLAIQVHITICSPIFQFHLYRCIDHLKSNFPVLFCFLRFLAFPVFIPVLFVFFLSFPAFIPVLFGFFLSSPVFTLFSYISCFIPVLFWNMFILHVPMSSLCSIRLLME